METGNEQATVRAEAGEGGTQSSGNGSVDGFDLRYPEPPKPRRVPRKSRGPIPMGYDWKRPIRKPKAPPESLFTLDWAFRETGGRAGAIALARLLAGTDTRLAEIVENWDTEPPETRKRSPKLLERLCVEAGIDPSEFLGLCAQAMHRYQFDAARLLANLHIEDIVAAGVEAATFPEGTADRKLLYEHMRFLPEKGPAVAVQVNTGQQGAALPDFKNLAEIAAMASRKELTAGQEEVIDVSYAESETDERGEPLEEPSSPSTDSESSVSEDLLG